MLLAFAHRWRLCESLKSKVEIGLMLRGTGNKRIFLEERENQKTKQNKTRKRGSVSFQLLTVPTERQRVLQELKEKLAAQSSGVSGN